MTQQKQEIHTIQHGLKCDNIACDYTYAFVETDTYEKYLNAPCPKCGSNLLTQEDLDLMNELMETIRLMNLDEYVPPALPQEIQNLIDQLEEPDKKVKLRMELVDGIPVMSSEDPEVQGIIDSIHEYYRSENEVTEHLNNLN